MLRSVINARVGRALLIYFAEQRLVLDCELAELPESIACSDLGEGDRAQRRAQRASHQMNTAKQELTFRSHEMFMATNQ